MRDYSKINFVNYNEEDPSLSTRLNATTMNKLDDGIYNVETKAIESLTGKFVTCDTDSIIVAKEADNDGFALEKGKHVMVKFAHANTANAPTLNVNSTGAKPIVVNGDVAITQALYWADGDMVDFVYDGTNWCMCGVPTSIASKFDSAINGINENLLKILKGSGLTIVSTYGCSVLYGKIGLVNSENGAGVIFSPTNRVKEITVVISDFSGSLVQIGQCKYSASLPSIVTNGTDRVSYINANTDGIYKFDFKGIASNFFVAGGINTTATIDIYCSEYY